MSFKNALEVTNGKISFSEKMLICLIENKTQEVVSVYSGLSMQGKKKFIENFNPSRGLAYSLIPDSNEADVNLAVEAAQKAFPAFPPVGRDRNHRWPQRQNFADETIACGTVPGRHG